MLKKYETRLIDITCEVTTSNGTIETLEGACRNANDVIHLVKSMHDIEKKMTSDDPVLKSAQMIEILAEQMTTLYGREPEWYLANIDHTTMSQIVQDAAKELIAPESDKAK